MELFYAQHIEQDKATFDQDESRHIVKSYRKREGDPLSFTIGDGILYQGEITSISRRGMEVKILQQEIWKKVWTGRLQLAVAATKNFNRVEWMVERMVELGLDQLTPIITTHSERRTWKSERLQRIIIAAAKQSLKCTLPIVDEAISWEEFVSNKVADRTYYFGHCVDGEKKPLQDINLKDENVCFCIGPEGDFSEKEIEQAIQADFQAISLGQQRLRTETAALKMGVAFHIYNDWE